MTRDEATERYINEIQSHMDRAYQELANLTELDDLGFVRDHLARAMDLIDYGGPEAYMESLRPEEEPDTSLGFPR